MLFSVIYSFECSPNASVNTYKPPDMSLWDMTECHYSEIDESDGKPVQERWKHRKYVAMLTREEFDNFVDHTGLYMEDVETMGSLGAPGFGIGWAPAASFIYNDYDVYADAYVTPIPTRIVDGKHEPIRENGANERDWDRVRAIMLNMYGY